MSDKPDKRPAFQFYPGDWRKDVQLRSCSLAARGLWIDLMCVMHDCEPYGHLVLNGHPMTPAKISGQIGVPPAVIKKLLAELLENGVARETAEGVIYSKRMVDDERKRNVRAAGGAAGAEHGKKGAEHGKKGGRPPASKGGSETPLPTPLEDAKKPPPSSSSSSSEERKDGSEAQAEARAGLDDEPPETLGHLPTPAGAVCRAMRLQGLSSTNPSDPRLKALIAQGATADEFAAVAKEAVDRGIANGWAWVLKVVEARRADAARVRLAPKPEAKPAWEGAA